MFILLGHVVCIMYKCISVECINVIAGLLFLFICGY